MPITLGRSYATNARSSHHLKTPTSRGDQKIQISNRLSLFIWRACALQYYVRRASILTLIQIGLLSLN